MSSSRTLDEIFPGHVAGFWGKDPGTQDLEVSVVRNGDILPDGSIRWDQLPARSVTASEFSRASLRPHDILLTTSGNCGRVGWIQELDIQACASNFTRRLRADPDLADSRYVYHLMNSDTFRRMCAPFVRGTTLQNLSVTNALASIRLPLPPLEKQRRIAGLLDAADALRAKRRRALAKLNSLTQSIFIDLFKQWGWDAWPAEPISELAADGKGTIRTGPFGSQLLHEEFTDEGIAVLGIDNAVQNRFVWAQRRYITPEKYEQLKRFTVYPGDVLVTIMGTCGRVAVVPEGIPTAINTKHLCCITLDQERMLPEFLWACLRFHPHVLHQLGATHGAVMPGLNMGLVKNAEVPVPALEIQEQLVGVYRELDAQSSRCATHEASLDSMYASLQQRAFRGEL